MAYVKTNWVAGVTPLSEANLDHLETQYDEGVTDAATHAALDTGVHGAGGDVLATDADIGTHAALDTGVHGAGGDTLATDADIAAQKLDDHAAADDNTDNNATTSAHGLLKKLDNNPLNFMNGQGNWASGAGLTVAETEVFNGASPQAFTDLDISAVVGSNVAFVILKVGTTDDDVNPTFRQNGDTEITEPSSFLLGPFAANIMMCDNNFAHFGYVICITDASGIIEWATDESQTVTIDVVAFIK
ncbi:MAG: hypothetical protein KAR06_04775 [Deltaproteobacteria bacterium]|nr:hypothetical protein [Deltaproteobacteria bacterium]